MDLTHTYDLSTTQERLYMAKLFKQLSETLTEPIKTFELESCAITEEMQDSRVYELVRALEELAQLKANRRRLSIR